MSENGGYVINLRLAIRTCYDVEEEEEEEIYLT